IDRAASLERLAQPDASLELILARSLVNAGPQPRERGIEILARLWQGAAKLEPELANEVGLAYGTALCWRAQVSDRKLAHDILAQVATTISDPSRKNVTEALSNLALQLTPR